jgi:hypothetical protein
MPLPDVWGELPRMPLLKLSKKSRTRPPRSFTVHRNGSFRHILAFHIAQSTVGALLRPLFGMFLQPLE